MALRSLFYKYREIIPREIYSQVKLGSGPCISATDSPVILIDCEMHRHQEAQNTHTPDSGVQITRRLAWTETNLKPGNQESIGLNLYSQVVGSFMATMCFLVDDLSGICGAQRAVAEIAMSCTASDTPDHCNSRAVVVSSSEMEEPNIVEEEASFHEGVIQLLRDSGKYGHNAELQSRLCPTAPRSRCEASDYTRHSSTRVNEKK